MAGPIPHGQQVGITIDATKAVAKLNRAKAALQVRDVLDTIGQKILRDTGLILQEAGKSPGGEPWKVMAPMTLRLRPLRRSSHHFSSPYQTLLQQSMNPQTGAGKTVTESTATVEIGTNVRYAKLHHQGDGKRLPARPLLPKAAYARTQAVRVVQAMVDVLARETGGTGA